MTKPFVVQYLLFLKNALTLDFGKTFAGQEVIDVIGSSLPVTIKLAIMAFCFEAIFGVVFGIISGLKKGKWYDSVILIVSLLLISVPTFVTGFVMQYFLGVEVAHLAGDRRRQPRIPRPADARHGARQRVDGIHHPTVPHRDLIEQVRGPMCAPREPRA